MLNFKIKYRIELAKTLHSHWYSVWEVKNNKEKFLGHFPSITTCLSAYPTSEQLVAWMAKEGYHESRELRDEAGRKGTRIHLAIQDLLEGITLQEINYSTEEWFKLSTFVNWHKEYKPEIIALELSIFSKKYKYAGRLDCIAKINDEIILIDWKSSRNLHNSFPIQFAAYANAVEEMTDLKIVNTAVLQLGTSSKKGYKYEIYPDWRKHLKVFTHVQKTWQFDFFDSKKNPKEAPVLILPEELKL